MRSHLELHHGTTHELYHDMPSTLSLQLSCIWPEMRFQWKMCPGNTPRPCERERERESESERESARERDRGLCVQMRERARGRERQRSSRPE